MASATPSGPITNSTFHLLLDLHLSMILAAAAGPTLASILEFLTQGVLILAAIFVALKWRWPAAGLVLFILKPFVTIALVYWVDAFSPTAGDASLDRWQTIGQITNSLTALALLFSLWQIMKRFGGVGARALPLSLPSRRKPARRKRKAPVRR